MTDSLKGLSGKDFEIQFLQEMIVHHQSATEMAQLVFVLYALDNNP